MTPDEPDVNLSAAARAFAHLWALSGAPGLAGYEACLVAVLARTDLETYGRLTAVDLRNPVAMLEAVETVRRWRRDVAASTRTFTFAPPPAPPAMANVGSFTPLRESAWVQSVPGDPVSPTGFAGTDRVEEAQVRQARSSSGTPVGRDSSRTAEPSR